MRGNLLILAHSGRMLAASARRAGYVPLVVDRFADIDTRRLAGVCIRVANFQPGNLLAAALGLIERYRPAGWLYGAGVDSMPGLVQALALRCPLYGNGAAVLRQCIDPRLFFPLLDRLGIAYPSIRWIPPAESGWLHKCGGSGGMGVHLWTGGDWRGEGYFQKRLPGKAYTLAFLADGSHLLWHGFNTLHHKSYNAHLPFLFAGAINRSRLPRRLADQVVATAQDLVRALGLRGWHGLDFLIGDQEPVVLELNPRPGAALALWDSAWPGGGVGAHIDACRGRRPPLARCVPVKGMRIAYASGNCKVAPSWRWPGWCTDLLGPGAGIAKGEPLCTIFATGTTVKQVESLLRWRLQWLRWQFQDKSGIEVETE